MQADRPFKHGDYAYLNTIRDEYTQVIIIEVDYGKGKGFLHDYNVRNVDRSTKGGGGVNASELFIRCISEDIDIMMTL